MIIERDYRPWLLVPRDDYYRGILSHALVERIDESRGVLVVADGFLMGVFDVSLDAEEEVGLIYAPLLRYASSCRGRANVDYRIWIDGERARMADGSLHPRVRETGDKDYPPWRRIAEPAIENVTTGERGFGSFAVNPRYVARIASAFGWQFAILMLGREPSDPIVLAPSVSDEWRKYGCYAVLMPMRIVGMSDPSEHDTEADVSPRPGYVKVPVA